MYTAITHPLLCQLAGTLVLAVPQQLDNTALVGGEASDLLDNVTNKSGALAQVALGAGHTGLDNARSGFLRQVSLCVQMCCCTSNCFDAPPEDRPKTVSLAQYSRLTRLRNEKSIKADGRIDTQLADFLAVFVVTSSACIVHWQGLSLSK